MKRFDYMHPISRVVDPVVAVAFDSAVESIITSAIAAQKPGTRVRSYAATDFMAREQCHQALLKLEMFQDLGLGLDGKLVFLINNAGAIGEHDINGNQIQLEDENGDPIPKIDTETGKIKKNELGEIRYQGAGKKNKVHHSKKLLDLGEHRKIDKWLAHPVFGSRVLLPDPRELETKWGMKKFGKNRVKFEKRFKKFSVVCVDEIIGNLIKIVTIEKKRR